nr:hypothetical protein [Bacillus sp. V5-8f]
MRSYLVDKVDTDGDISNVSGRGYGHGVGLSQHGAKIAGEFGKSYREILAFYYQNTTIKQAYEPTIEQVNTFVPFTLSKDVVASSIKNTAISFDSEVNKVYFKHEINETAKVSILVKDSKGKAVAALSNNSPKAQETNGSVGCLKSCQWKVTTIFIEKKSASNKVYYILFLVVALFYIDRI